MAQADQEQDYKSTVQRLRRFVDTPTPNVSMYRACLTIMWFCANHLTVPVPIQNLSDYKKVSQDVVDEIGILV